MTPSASAPIGEKEAAELFEALDDAGGLLLAVSGGPDSAAMMLLFARWRRAGRRPPVAVASVDHGLRPDARLEAEAVAAWAKKHGLAHRILAWRGAKPSTGIQEAAREARYRLLAAHARKIGASHIVLAHHADDQAETVLFRLLRGSGFGGLKAMAAIQPREGLVLARPLLGVPKSRLIATCEEARQPYFDDPANTDERFARARLRALMPTLARQGLARTRLLRLAARAQRAEEALGHTAERLWARLERTQKPQGTTADLSPLAGEPAEIIIRVIGRLVAEVAGDQKPLRLERLEALAFRMITALEAGEPLKATLGGAVIAVDDQGKVLIVRENTRRRGRKRSR